MSNVDVAGLRKEYTQRGLADSDVGNEPMAEVKRWFEDAVAAGVHEPNAMTLATLGPDGHPDARVVLLKGVGVDGLTFFTNRQSAKGQQLAAHPHAALVLFWPQLERQVRVRGAVEVLPRSDDETYFARRPRGSQLGAWASPQSRVVEGRAALEASLLEMEAKFQGGPVPCPPHWGGYRVKPVSVELWQGRENRLHDRLVYERQGTTWIRKRLGA
jgi:pyridoxamine 5'-phosphate oxidase